MPRRPLTIGMNPFPPPRQAPLWVRIIVTPLQLAAVIIMLPVGLALVLLVIVLTPVFLLCFFIWDKLFGIKGRKETEPPSYWPSSVRTIAAEHFEEVHVSKSGEAWLKATFPAFARFGSRYPELADWVCPDLPPPGEVAVLLGSEFSRVPLDTAEYRKLYDWLERHQEAIAEAIKHQLPAGEWLAELLGNEEGDETVPIEDRFRISSVVLECSNRTPGYEQLVYLRVDQTWDIEHAWHVEISGIRADGFDELEFGSM